MEKTIGKYKIEIFQDENSINPLDDDNLGTMICFHSRYDLGNKHNYDPNDYGSWDEMKEAIMKREKVAVILPLYLYDHGGITMNTTGFDCRWDSTQVGFIYISKQKILSEYGGKIVTKKLKEKIKQYLINEVNRYDQYLRGDVYGYCITDTETDEMVDSCWGFYGDDYCITEAEDCVNSYIE